MQAQVSYQFVVDDAAAERDFSKVFQRSQEESVGNCAELQSLQVGEARELCQTFENEREREESAKKEEI